MIHMLIQDIKIIPQIVLAAKRVRTSSIGGGFALGESCQAGCRPKCCLMCFANEGLGLSGRVSSEVSSDVCMGEGSQIFWVRFGSVGQGQRIHETFPCYLGSMLLQCYVL